MSSPVGYHGHVLPERFAADPSSLTGLDIQASNTLFPEMKIAIVSNQDWTRHVGFLFVFPFLSDLKVFALSVQFKKQAFTAIATGEDGLQRLWG